jgi:hypothetical protein
MNTHSHHFAGPSRHGSEHPPRGLVRVQVPRARRPLRDRVRERGQQRPGLRAGARQGGRRDVRALPDRPVTSEFMLRAATYRSVSSIAMKPSVNRPLPIAFGGPGAITVVGTRHPHSRLYRRRQCAAALTIPSQFSCSPDQ